jgi:hypothetical protein
MSDGLYGSRPDPDDDFGIRLGAIAPRGERNVLIASLDSLLRLTSNPFFAYLAERIEEGLPANAPRGRIATRLNRRDSRGRAAARPLAPQIRHWVRSSSETVLSDARGTPCRAGYGLCSGASSSSRLQAPSGQSATRRMLRPPFR